MADTPLRRYFRLPEDVKTVDFVHQIDRRASPERTAAVLGDYVVTPSVGRNLEAALDNVRRGLSAKRSVFTWIHGSFGSGKSHFMDVLSLLLADEKAVYSAHAELQAHRAKFHPEVIGRRLFRLHVQCISRGATTLEEIVFGAAVEELARLHPEAPAPAVFEVQRVFESARRLLADLGEAKFFAAFPSNREGAGDDAWGDLGGQLWDRARFEAAAAAPQSDEGRKLAGELAKTPWLEGMAASAGFVKLGPGLSILADHLRALGYEGVLLFLDELVLWLSTFQDPRKLALETPKVSTLVEHGDYRPALPYLTFAARQRDLSQMVGKVAAGRDEVIFRDHLAFWKDRFETIELEDKDLARIIERRVLHPLPGAKAELDTAFESYKRAFAQDFRKLHGDQGDAEDFRRVYPLSPALVEVMVALSSTLQRDRTALRELTRLLVQYLPDFELGKVVPVGDLFDVVAHGQTSDMPAIQKLYEQARRIYESDLLPHVRAKNKTDSAARCQLLRESFDPRLGCSGCAEKACRTQTRIAKTILLQGLVPNTPVLKSLTASSLVHLNSGTLKSKVPNQEPTMAANLVREWADLTPAVHFEPGPNPVVRGALDAIDVRRILDHCRELDNEHRKRMRVREVLFDRMGIARKDQAGAKTIDWRGRKWRLGVVYENTREANDNVFRAGPDEDLRLVIDYPFDEVGHNPREDEDRVQEVIAGLTGKEAARGRPVVVWLPAFLGEEAKQALADLVTLDGLVALSEQSLAARIPWIPLDEIPRAKQTLEQQQGMKLSKLGKALESAYGISHENDALLAPGLAPTRNAWQIRRQGALSVPAGGLFEAALTSVIGHALGAWAARHPELGKAPTRDRLERVLDLVDRLLDTPERKVKLTRAELDELRAIAGAPNFDIVRVIDDDAMFTGGVLDHVTKNLSHHKGQLSVGALRAAIDPDGFMELSPELQDLLVLIYMKATPRPLRLVGRENQTQGLIGKLTDDMGLVQVELPGHEAWQRALATAELLGVAPGGKALTPARMDDLASGTRRAAEGVGAARIAEAIRELQAWQTMAGVEREVAETQRGEVLATIRDLVGAIPTHGESKVVVEALASFRWEAKRATAIVCMTSNKRLDALLDLLGNGSLKAQIELGRSLEREGAAGSEAQAVMDGVRRVLTSDENADPLRTGLEQAVSGITQILVAHREQTKVTTEELPLTRPEQARIPKATEPGALLGDATAFEAPPVAVHARPPSVTPPRKETIPVRNAGDVAAMVARIEGELGAGKRLLVTIEIVDGEDT